MFSFCMLHIVNLLINMQRFYNGMQIKSEHLAAFVIPITWFSILVDTNNTPNNKSDCGIVTEVKIMTDKLFSV